MVGLGVRVAASAVAPSSTLTILHLLYYTYYTTLTIDLGAELCTYYTTLTILPLLYYTYSTTLTTDLGAELGDHVRNHVGLEGALA